MGTGSPYKKIARVIPCVFAIVIPLTGLDSCGSAIRMSILILAALALRVIPAPERESPVRAGFVQGSLV